MINNGSDGNTIHDVCQTPLTAGASFPFTIVGQPPPVIDTILYSGCAPTLIKVALNKIVSCGSISNSGSEFSISPGLHQIASVQTSCSGSPSATDTIIIQLQNPLPFGNYQLTVNNGTDGNTLVDTCGTSMVLGYNFPFVINQVTAAPAVQTIAFDECKPFQVVVNFDKLVACNTISPNGSEFTISPGAFSVSGISLNCVNGMATQAVLTLSGNLPAGNFSLLINNGSDGNSIADSCFAFIAAPYSFAFATTQAPAPVYDSVQYDRCSPNTIKIFYSKPILCNSVNLNGAEFSITGAAAVAITGVTIDATCNNGYTNWVELHLSQPLNTMGTFVLHNVAGADGNSVQDTCYASQNNNETIAFNVLGKPSANFADALQFGCVMDTLVVSHPGGNGINSWQWTFSDGTMLTGPAVAHMFPVSTVTAAVQLVVSNGVCNDTLSRTYSLNNAFAVGFTTSADTVCRRRDIIFTNTSTGNNLNYTWNFGDGSSFTGQQPPPHSYAAAGNYSVTLTAGNNHFCTSDSVRIVHVTD
ncbi:MAG: PKD domain-containing protein, partial [Sphingobacteriales bacterium]